VDSFGTYKLPFRYF